MNPKEFGVMCGSCKLLKESRTYYRQCFGKNLKARDAHLSKWRRLCKSCWELAELGEL